jgi:hypothetical protein
MPKELSKTHALLLGDLAIRRKARENIRLRLLLREATHFGPITAGNVATWLGRYDGMVPPMVIKRCDLWAIPQGHRIAITARYENETRSAFVEELPKGEGFEDLDEALYRWNWFQTEVAF